MLACAGPASAAGIGNAGDDLRTGWYPDAGAITPQLVSGGTFGQLWSAPVDGQVYAQPLLSPTGTLIVATENDKVYGLDPSTGAPQWTTDLGTPWNPGDLGCADITPSIGTTATPVIDTATKTVYLTHKTYDASHDAEWYMDALDVATGQERPGFPVQLSGGADNAPSMTFDAQDQQQRPGLLLLDGVVYAGFGSHCDVRPYQGWIFGVSTAGAVTARWVAVSSDSGAGIWQSGVGLASDGSGSILFATGNEGAPSSPSPGSSPPPNCAECVMRLQVQPDGSLKPVDFFAPFDASKLDQYDADFGSGGVVGLPDASFGTPSIPHLAVAVGKQGYVYLLNRDSLGGFAQGAGGGDGVLQRIGPRAGVWGRAGVWPGDGGYVYITTSAGPLDVYQYSVSGSGTPSLALAGSAWDDAQNGPAMFGWGSGPPIITSDGTNSGSALVWVIWSADRQGDGGELRAYDPVPVNGQLALRYSAPIGTATNYSDPGVGAGRIYVGTRDGTVLAFGSPVTQPLTGSALSFGRTTIGTSPAPQKTMTLTANRDLTITSLTSSNDQFTPGTASPPLPATLSAGQSITVPVTFSPNRTGPVAGQLTAGTDQGNEAFSLAGTGQAGPGQLAGSPAILSLGGIAVGQELSGTVSFSNVGGQPLTIRAVHPPNAPSTPFAATGLPGPGDTLDPGHSITINIAFDPTTVGSFTDAIGLDTSGGNLSIGLSASAGTPGHLQISGQTVDFGSVTIGASASKTFTISNTGGSSVTITRSKPPFGGAFAATTSLPEGLKIAPGQTLSQSVTFAPTAPGAASGTWSINSDDGSGPHDIQFTGTGAAASTAGPSPSGAPPAATTASSPQHPTVPTRPKVTPAVASPGKLAGTYISYTATAAATSHFVLRREITGRRGAHGCVAATAQNRARSRCTRFVDVAAFTHRDHAGADQLRLAAYVPVSRLAPGVYRLESILLDSDRQKHVFYTEIRVTAPPRERPATRANLLRLGAETPFLATLATLL